MINILQFVNNLQLDPFEFGTKPRESEIMHIVKTLWCVIKTI